MIKLFLCSLIGISSLWLHDFHVSIINGELNPRSGNLELSLKVFSDDLEEAVKADLGVSCYLSPERVKLLPDTALFSYLQSHIKLKTGDKQWPLQYVGMEKEQDITFIYLQVENFPAVNELTVYNSLFFNRFDDQSNIVNIEVEDELQSVFLESSHPQKTLYFD